MNTEFYLEPLSNELSSARLGDGRRVERLGAIVDAFSQNPAGSFPEVMGAHAALEAAYRFLRNPDVTFDKILNPHLDSSCKRVIAERESLIIHDTSIFKFSGKLRRHGLGWIDASSTQGFLGHFAFAVSAGAEQTPLGIVGMHPFTRHGKAKGRKSHFQRRNDPTSESKRWQKMVEQVEGRIGSNADIIHVMDREADFYGIFEKLSARGSRFVIRLRYNRPILDAQGVPIGQIADAFNNVPIFLEREVSLSQRNPPRRPPRARKRHPDRESRVAKLAFSASKVVLKRPVGESSTLPVFLPFNVVRVQELNPPRGVKPVEWALITSEPIDTHDQVAHIVDIYRKRWLIEEFFKALKTGCGFEKRQLESLPTILNTLAILIPVAWRLLLLRNLSRTSPDARASTVMTPRQLAVLRAFSNKKIGRHPTANEVLLAIASLGGHIPNNGPPGWLVLGRGYNHLLWLERVWKKARK